MLSHAPGPLVVDGLPAVPITIRQLTASVTLDARAGTGAVDALMRYEVGPTAGCPLFDLRQPIDAAFLDGTAIDPTRLRARAIGAGPAATMRVLDLPQAARSGHDLRFRYRLGSPLSDLGGAYPPVLAARAGGRLRWSFGMADLFDGRHLEMWFPSNLPFDQFPFELAVAVTGAGTAHTLISNGSVTAVGAHRWQLAFPAWFTTVCPLVELHPTDELVHARQRVALPGPARSVIVDVWKPAGTVADPAREAGRIRHLLTVNDALFGPFPADRFTCFLHDGDGGMEYAGATTTSAGALAHEVAHSWFARGVLPASDADGWWDEAYTTYLTSGAAPAPLDFGRPPVQLCSRRPFQRHTDARSYVEGSRLFSGIAAMIGAATLTQAMRTLFRTRVRSCLSTAELEEHLVRQTGAAGIVDAFHRFVYGFADAPTGGVRLDRLWLAAGPDGRPWINAQVSNDRLAPVCRHFLLLLSSARFGAQGGESFAASRRVAAVAGFDLAPGRSRHLRVPAAGVRPDAYADAIVLTGAVQARQSHPSGLPGDHRNRTELRIVLRRVAAAHGRRSAVC